MALPYLLGITSCVPEEKSFLFHIINLLLTKLVRWRWLDIGLARFLPLKVFDTDSVHEQAKIYISAPTNTSCSLIGCVGSSPSDPRASFSTILFPSFWILCAADSASIAPRSSWLSTSIFCREELSSYLKSVWLSWLECLACVLRWFFK